MFLIVPFIAIFGAVLRPVLDLIADEGAPAEPGAPATQSPGTEPAPQAG
jgi:hypothetical protein